MTTTHPNLPLACQPAERADSGGGLVALHLSIKLRESDHEQMLKKDYLPPGNRLGTLLLVSVLSKHLALAGIIAEDQGGGIGPFNECTAIFTVCGTQQSAAASAIQSALDELGFSGFAEIAVFDVRELIWRTTYPPHCTEPFGRWIDESITTAERARTTELVAALKNRHDAD